MVRKRSRVMTVAGKGTLKMVFLAQYSLIESSFTNPQAKVVVEVLFGDINPFVLFPALLVFRSIGVGVPADGAHRIIGKKVLEEVQRSPSSRR